MTKEKNPEITNLVVEINSKLHRDFKSKCSSDGNSIKEVITELMENYVSNA